MEEENIKKPENSSGEPIHNIFSFGEPKSDSIVHSTDSESNHVANGRISVSSTSSNSSFDGFFKPNNQLFPKSKSPKEQNEGPNPQFFENSSKVQVSSDTWRRLGESAKACPKLSSQFSDVTIKSFVPDVAPNTRCPPAQIMERPGNFDPDRIPPSVFSSKPSNSVDWSTASNESLFSIHVGNESFSRDHALGLSGELPLSGEIPKSGELFTPGGLFPSQELHTPEKIIRKGGKSHDDVKVVEFNEHVYVHDHDEPCRRDSSVGDYFRPSSANEYSDGSEISTLPLAFPRNKKSSSKSSRHCCSCCCCFSSCCSCKWLRWLCCCNWCHLNWKWPRCHFKCPTLTCCCKCTSCWNFLTCNKCKQ